MEYLNIILSGLAIIISILSFWHTKNASKYQQLKDKIKAKQNILNISNDITFTLEHIISYLEERRITIKMIQKTFLIDESGSKLNDMLRTINSELEKHHKYLQKNNDFIDAVMDTEIEKLNDKYLAKQLEVKNFYLNNIKILLSNYNTIYKILDKIVESEKS